jgi:uncharacterized protein (TIGR00255 family)
MTGFASLGRDNGGDRINVTIKSVNHRFLDVQVKTPQSLAGLEARVRTLVQQRLTRGRVEVSLSAELAPTQVREVVLDEALLERLVQAFAGARDRGLVSGELTIADVLRLPQVVEVRVRGADAPGVVSEALAALADQALGEALDSLVTMRTTEGAFLQADLEARLVTLLALVDELEQLARDGQQQLDARLRERLAGLPPDLAGDPAALAQEVVRFVARSDIDEELVRLRSHVEHWRALTLAPEPCGRKLDFLVQEMNREVNTLGSKAEGARATEVVIDAKAELERLREQVQNVE